MSEKGIFYTLGAALGVAFPEYLGKFLICLLILMGIDFVTGIRAAKRKKKTINSREMGRTADKCVSYLSLTLISLIFMIVGKELFKTDFSALPGVVIGFLISRETLSIFENVEKMGIKVPQRIKEILNMEENEQAKETV